MSDILFLGNFKELRVRNVLINANSRHEHYDFDTFKKKGIKNIKKSDWFENCLIF